MTLKGWIFHRDQGMRHVEFEVDDGSFSARMDGEIWDYSEDPWDFVDYVDDRVYTVADQAKCLDTVMYTDPVSLRDWFNDNGVECP